MPGSDVWCVVKVPFPYTNRPVQQRRPALVVGRFSEPGSPALLWVLMITRATHRRWSGDVDVSDLAAAGLPVPSIVRTAKIASIEADAADPIGRLPASDRAAVSRCLAGILAGAL